MKNIQKKGKCGHTFYSKNYLFNGILIKFLIICVYYSKIIFIKWPLKMYYKIFKKFYNIVFIRYNF